MPILAYIAFEHICTRLKKEATPKFANRLCLQATNHITLRMLQRPHKLTHFANGCKWKCFLKSMYVVRKQNGNFSLRATVFHK